MQTRTLGKTNLSVSVLGFGSAPVGFLATDQQKVANILNLLLDAGVNLLDTAAMYQGAEEMIGKTVAHRRSDYVLVSKCGHKIPEVDGPPWAANVISGTVDRALKRLQTDVLDVMMLHSCDLKTLQNGEAMETLIKARDAGKIKFVGYSGDNEAAAYAASLPDVAVIETSVSVVDQQNIDRVLPVCVQHDVGVLAKRPIGNAAWRGADRFTAFYKNYTKPYVDRWNAMKLTPEQIGFTGSPDDVWPEVALRFTLGQSGVTCAIIGTTSEMNAGRNIEYADKGPIDPVAGEAIRKAFRSADPERKWIGQT